MCAAAFFRARQADADGAGSRAFGDCRREQAGKGRGPRRLRWRDGRASVAAGLQRRVVRWSVLGHQPPHTATHRRCLSGRPCFDRHGAAGRRGYHGFDPGRRPDRGGRCRRVHRDRGRGYSDPFHAESYYAPNGVDFSARRFVGTRAGPGCTQAGQGVRCPVPPVTSIVVMAGDGADIVRVGGSEPDLPNTGRPAPFRPSLTAAPAMTSSSHHSAPAKLS